MKAALRLTLSIFLAMSFAHALLGADDPKKLESTAQVKAYRANLKAMRAGDWDAYKKSMVKEAGPQMEKQIKDMGKTPKDMLQFMSMMTPTDLTISSVKVDGKKATLLASGKLDGKLNKGTVEMAEEDGQWKVGQQSWTDAK